MVRHCIAFKRDGGACRAWVMRGSAYCFWHHPNLKTKRKLASARGGSVTLGDRGVEFWSKKHRQKHEMGRWG